MGSYSRNSNDQATGDQDFYQVSTTCAPYAAGAAQSTTLQGEKVYFLKRKGSQKALIANINLNKKQ